MSENATKRRPKSFVERRACDAVRGRRDRARSRTGAPCAPCPCRSPIAVDTTWTRLSVSSTQSTGTSWMRRPLRSASKQQLGVEEPAVVLDRGQEPPRDVGPHRLEPALRVAHARREHRAQDQVVAARDELALRVAGDVRTRREPRTDRDVGVARHERRDERQERVEIGREVDVHVRDDVGVARAPRASAARGRGPCGRGARARTPGELAREPLGVRTTCRRSTRCRRS